jgi:hypothetical protein
MAIGKNSPMQFACMRAGIVLTVLAGAILAAGCAGNRPTGAERQYLDTASGITVTGLEEPAIFHHADPRLAANVRDYLYVGPVVMNRVGKYSFYLWLGEWSTIDRLPGRKSSAGMGSAGAAIGDVVLLLDGVPMELHDSLDRAEESRIIQPPYTSSVDSMRAVYMRVSRDQLGRIAAANNVVIRVSDAGQMRTYKLWSGNTRSFGLITKEPAATNSEQLAQSK